MIKSEERIKPCPDNIVVIGGGRWARVIVTVLYEIVPLTTTITIYLRHNLESMVAWISARGFGDRIQLTNTWPRLFSTYSCAVIVVNAARDHLLAVERALSAGVPVLVEKPIALSYKDVQQLASLAADLNGRLATSQIFLFARYLENFSALVTHTGSVGSLYIDWADPKGEQRYGENKHYDAGLPVFIDWLPHVIPIAGFLLPISPNRCNQLRFFRGGASIELDLMAGNISCTVRLERNAEQRRRIIQATINGKVLKLDFSREPGVIRHGQMSEIGDKFWDTKKRPLARMLTVFLSWAAGGEEDERIDIHTSLQSYKLIDQVGKMYRSQQIPWLISELAKSRLVDADIDYALSEIFLAAGPFSRQELDLRIEKLQTIIDDPDVVNGLKKIGNACESARLLRVLTLTGNDLKEK